MRTQMWPSLEKGIVKFDDTYKGLSKQKYRGMFESPETRQVQEKLVST